LHDTVDHLLDGICAEVIELLKDREFSVELGRIIRKMKPRVRWSAQNSCCPPTT
jgi:predicted nucleic-acid-binding protein